MISSILTIDHFYAANFPVSIFEGSFCDISAFFNCDSSAFSVISHLYGIPLGYLGLFVGGLVVLGLLFPSVGFERTNKTISLVNVLGVFGLLFFSIFYLGSLCLLCSGYYLFSIFNFVLFAKQGIDRESKYLWRRYFQPSLRYIFVFAIVFSVGAYGFMEYYTAKTDAQSGGVSTRIVQQYYNLPQVALPSEISPFWIVRSTAEFNDAPIRVIEYADLLCPDCQYLHEQLKILKEEFAGKINIVFQFFPLEALCNQVVEKDLHPGACELSYMAAFDSSKFNQIHDEIFSNLTAARDPEWRRALAEKHQVGAALSDTTTINLVQRLINTGSEYERTSDQYSHGIRSTPSLIINNRMIIGTFPIEHMRSIFQALVDEQTSGQRFLESWVD